MQKSFKEKLCLWVTGIAVVVGAINISAWIAHLLPSYASSFLGYVALMVILGCSYHATCSLWDVPKK